MASLPDPVRADPLRPFLGSGSCLQHQALSKVLQIYDTYFYKTNELSQVLLGAKQGFDYT